MINRFKNGDRVIVVWETNASKRAGKPFACVTILDDTPLGLEEKEIRYRCYINVFLVDDDLYNRDIEHGVPLVDRVEDMHGIAELVFNHAVLAATSCAECEHRFICWTRRYYAESTEGKVR